MAGAKHSSSWHPRTGDFWKENILFNFFLSLQFKFASSLDYFLVVFGVVLALCGGAGGPILMVMFGAIIQVTSLTNSHISIYFKTVNHI